ncbi:MAG: hypothetical protein EOP84_06820 [Verrucomicrobiaceae bacterium]|nr:MAG: hypothetical protein EOP84_06820 [Verrucomicrobiaceae bacterium]
MRRRLAAVIACFVFHEVSSATDWMIPDPVTYEWTVKATQAEIPLVEWKGTSIRDAIGYLGDSMNFPLRLRHDLPDAVLDRRMDWQATKVTWLQVVGKVADVADADIVIGKQREVTLKRRAPAEKAGGSGKGKLRPLGLLDPDPDNPGLQVPSIFEEDAFFKMREVVTIGDLRISAWRSLHDPSTSKQLDEANPKKIELLVKNTASDEAGWLPLTLGESYKALKFVALDYRCDIIGSPDTGQAAVITTDLSLLVAGRPEPSRYLVLRTFSGRSGDSEGFFSKVVHPPIIQPKSKKPNGEQADAGQPTTGSESDLEDGDKPQPESEERSR